MTYDKVQAFEIFWSQHQKGCSKIHIISFSKMLLMFKRDLCCLVAVRVELNCLSMLIVEARPNSAIFRIYHAIKDGVFEGQMLVVNVYEEDCVTDAHIYYTAAQNSVGCNYLSLLEIPASGTKVLIFTEQ